MSRSYSSSRSSRSDKSEKCLVLDADTFYLNLIEAFNDESVASSIAKALQSQFDSMLDKIAVQMDTKVKHFVDLVKDKDEKIDSLENTVEDLQYKLDEYEQYSRQEALRFSGIKENDDENTDNIITTICNNVLKVDPPLQPSDIARSHRSGDPKKIKNRQILVKFTTYNIRDKVIRARKKLKEFNKDENENIYINEDLTKTRAQLAYKARMMKKEKLINEVWTWDGVVRVKDLYNKVHVINRETDFEKLKAWLHFVSSFHGVLDIIPNHPMYHILTRLHNKHCLLTFSA